MFLIAIKSMGAFADGDKVVEPSMANGGGGCGYIIMVGNNYWGKFLYEMDDWYVDFQTRKMDILQVICNR